MLVDTFTLKHLLAKQMVAYEQLVYYSDETRYTNILFYYKET
jgi:hypothetical protein